MERMRGGGGGGGALVLTQSAVCAPGQTTLRQQLLYPQEHAFFPSATPPQAHPGHAYCTGEPVQLLHPQEHAANPVPSTDLTPAASLVAREAGSQSQQQKCARREPPQQDAQQQQQQQQCQHQHLQQKQQITQQHQQQQQYQHQQQKQQQQQNSLQQQHNQRQQDSLQQGGEPACRLSWQEKVLLEGRNDAHVSNVYMVAALLAVGLGGWVGLEQAGLDHGAAILQFPVAKQPEPPAAATTPAAITTAARTETEAAAAPAVATATAAAKLAASRAGGDGDEVRRCAAPMLDYDAWDEPDGQTLGTATRALGGLKQDWSQVLSPGQVCNGACLCSECVFVCVYMCVCVCVCECVCVRASVLCISALTCCVCVCAGVKCCLRGRCA